MAFSDNFVDYTSVHELGHAMGVLHEQARSDDNPATNFDVASSVVQNTINTGISVVTGNRYTALTTALGGSRLRCYACVDTVEEEGAGIEVRRPPPRRFFFWSCCLDLAADA